MEKLSSSTITLFYILFILANNAAYAQNSATYQQKVNTELSKLDLTGIKNDILLKLSIFNSVELDLFRNLKPKPNQKQTFSNSENWENLYERLSRAQLVKDQKKFPEFSLLTETNVHNRTKNNIISIGIMDIEGTLLFPSKK